MKERDPGKFLEEKKIIVLKLSKLAYKMEEKAKTWVSEKTRSQSMAWDGVWEGGNRHQNERVTLGTHGQDLYSPFLVGLCVTWLEISICILSSEPDSQASPPAL